MKKANRIIAILISLLLTGSSILSCGTAETAEETQVTSETIAETTAIETEPETEPDPFADRTLQDSVPELDFGGTDFRSMSQDGACVQDIYVEDMTGEALNDVIYNRNISISERFNVNITAPDDLAWDALGRKVKATVAAGDDAYDLVLGQMAESSSAALSGYFRNLLELPHFNFENPWYPKSMMQEGLSTVNGKLYMAVSDMLLSYTTYSWAVVFDKVYAENYGITGVYDIVRNGEWTLDKMIELTEDIYTDTNNDGVKDENDFYGLAYRADGCGFIASLYALGVRTMEVKDQKAIMTLNTETNASIFEKIYSMLQKPGTCQGPMNGLWPEQIMKNGNSVFATMSLYQIQRSMREYDKAFGIIPLPKWSEEQKEYYSTSDAGCNVITVLTTAQNLEMIGAVTEALSAESWRSVMPVLCDVALGTKMARDQESIAMVDLVLDSRYIDFAYLYNGWDGWTFKSGEFIAQEGVFASTYAKHEKAVQNHYDKLLKFFYES
ncbi:MAG: hypothetical protein IJB52_00900 [Clostridia bacterium]|nr:hypothetical protein [Clostridia bacterium]